jgi:Flp pilus assembly protein TadD
VRPAAAWLGAFLATLGMACGRSAEPPAAATSPKAAAARVLFVGLDGADWPLLDALMAEGRMPELAALCREGRVATLRTIQPPLSPLIWTTMMTGVSPLEHGILDFTRFHPQTRRREPITSDERQVPAVWNHASDALRRVAVFGLWATYPAEPIRGLMVSDRFYTFASLDAPPAGSVFPPEQEAWARGVLTAVEAEVGFDALRAYLPWLDNSTYDEAINAADPYTRPIAALRRILIETRLYARLAAEHLERQPETELTVVYFQGTDTIGHVFAPFMAPRLPTIDPRDFERFSGVPARYFAEVDAVLGTLRRSAAQQGAALMLASDHGFLWQEGRPHQVESLAAASAGRWHREDGMALLWGRGSSPDREPGQVAQVAATLHALLDLPTPASLAQPPLFGLPPSSTAPPLQRKPATPTRQDAADPAAEAAADEEVAKLRALGYLGADESASTASSAGTRTPGSFNNEGLLRRQAGDVAAARTAFEAALALEPNHAAALANLSDLLVDAEPARADRLLLAAAVHGLAEGPQRVIGRAMAWQRKGDAERGLSLLDAAVAGLGNEAELWLFRGRLRLERQDCRNAQDDFARVTELAPTNALGHLSLGLALLCLGDEGAARRAFERSLELDPEQPELRRRLERR